MPRFQPNEPTNDIERLLQLVQIAKLASDPQQQQQELDQREQATRVTAALHLMGIQQQQQQSAAALGETERYHTGELEHLRAALEASQKERDATTQGNITDALISHLAARPDVPLSVLGDTLRARGHGELADTLDKAHAGEVQRKVATLLPAITAAHAKSPEMYKQVLDTVKADPDVWAAIQPHLPTDAPAPPSAIATTTPAYFPGIAGPNQFSLKYAPIDSANLGAAFYNKLLAPSANLINSLVGAPAVHTVPYMPRDYELAWKNLLKPQPTQ